MKRKNKQPERPFTPNAQQFEKAFNIISNIDNYNMPTFKNMVETSSVAELQDIKNVFCLKGFTITERLKRVSEHTGEMHTLVGLRNHLASAITRLQDKFIDNVPNEYLGKHGSINTRKINEDIKIQIGIRAATATMSDA
jgi:hypothetical protein